MRSFFILLIILASLSVQAQEFYPNYNYPIKKVGVNGFKLAYIEEGKGPETLLFIHGLGGYVKHWQQNIATLSKNYRCIAVDLPGYGHSQNGLIKTDNLLTLFSETLSLFIKQLNIDKVTVIGHSMGGQLAVVLALDHPEQVKNLVLVAPAGFEQFSEQEKTVLKQFATADFFKNQTEAVIRKAFDLNFYKIPEAAEELIQDRLRLTKTAYINDYAAVLVAGVYGMLNRPVYHQLRTLAMPVLILFGTSDQLIPNRGLHPTLTTESVAAKGASQIRNSKLVLIKEAGHLLQLEQPQEFHKAVIAFLSDHSFN